MNFIYINTFIQIVDTEIAEILAGQKQLEIKFDSVRLFEISFLTPKSIVHLKLNVTISIYFS